MEIDDKLELDLRYQAKAMLRKRARALRNTIPRSAVAHRSARIVAAVARLPGVVAARSVALFEPIEARNEVDLRELDARLRAAGARVAYPSIDPDTRVMTFRFVDDRASLVERGMGFCEPDPSAPEAESLDVIVVPALQLDPLGNRIGYGAGYYDRTLPRFAPTALTVGVAFGFQMIVEVPVTAGDVPVALIVTDEQVIELPAA